MGIGMGTTAGLGFGGLVAGRGVLVTFGWGVAVWVGRGVLVTLGRGVDVALLVGRGVLGRGAVLF